MTYVKRWFSVMVVGGTLLLGLTHCVVAPAPIPSGYVVSPPVVVIRPYRLYRPYHPHGPYHGWYPSRDRW